jgi:XTP/dITP diphosphohydrolase
MNLLIATTNPGKLAEIRHFLGTLPVTLVGLKDAGITDAVEETGETFEENAKIKASYYAKKSGMLTIADDGGFEIDGLNGEPGVHSHRWVDNRRESSDEELINYTFERMKDIPEDKRGAQLRLVLALATPDGNIVAPAEEKIRGIVPMVPSDTRHEGFPYRSILFIPEINKFYDHMSFTPEETERYNHRKHAVDRLIPTLKSLLQGGK